MNAPTEEPSSLFEVFPISGLDQDIAELNTEDVEPEFEHLRNPELLFWVFDKQTHQPVANVSAHIEEGSADYLFERDIKDYGLPVIQNREQIKKVWHLECFQVDEAEQGRSMLRMTSLCKALTSKIATLAKEDDVDAIYFSTPNKKLHPIMRKAFEGLHVAKAATTYRGGESSWIVLNDNLKLNRMPDEISFIGTRELSASEEIAR